ncbi:hypothetical protein D9M68_737260 [compost metagenome]
MLGDFPGIHAQLDRRVVQPRSVQVQRQAAPTRQFSRRRQVVQRQHLALHGVFQGQQTGAGKMEVVLLDRRLDLCQVQRAIGLAVDRLRLDRAEHRGTTPLIFISVRLLADDVLVATLAMGHQAKQVAHGAGRHEQRSGETQALRQIALQAVDRRVFAIHVIAQFSAQHGLAHARRGLGDGVAAQVDDGHWRLP